MSTASSNRWIAVAAKMARPKILRTGNRGRPRIIRVRPKEFALDCEQRFPSSKDFPKGNQILQRPGKRQWPERYEDGLIRSCQIVSCGAGCVAEICLEPNMNTTPVDTLLDNEGLFVEVLKAAPNSIRVHVNGTEDRLSEDDIMYVDRGADFSITNISTQHRAVVSITLILSNV